jgi:replicative DNA helicase
MSPVEEYLRDEAGEHVLACLLTSPSGRTHLPGALESVRPEDFHDPHYGELWRIAGRLVAAGEHVTARALLADKDTPAARARIAHVQGRPVIAATIGPAIRSVLDMAERRRLVQSCDRIIDAAVSADGWSELHQMATEQISALKGGTAAPEVLSWDDIAERWWQPEDRGRVIPTPWPEVSQALAGGLRTGRTYVVAGRPGAGKSIVGLNLAAAAAEDGHPTLLFSVEMGWREIASRLMASGGRGEYGEIVRGEMGEDTHRRSREYHERTRTMPLHLVDREQVSVEYIAATARTHQRLHGLDLVVVDYMQLLAASDRSVVREQQVAHISRSLKMLARELDCAVVVMAQLNRGQGGEVRKPTLRDLRESGSIEQDADVVILLHHEVLEGTPTGEVEVIIAKNRTGPTLDVALPWRGHQARVG